ncbi:unnamed protein product [Echinostoma caproni]|uniref:O-fucosyltransferase family protein n=1 Tax=Echinostoma caproni TaxID=27848 RepID=A0A183ANE8_9TREM|nr:unnamed protein product [Echinostoma caproni]
MSNAVSNEVFNVKTDNKPRTLHDFKWEKILSDEQLIMKAEVDILMAMYLVKKAWVSAYSHVLINAFMKAGFKFTLIQSVMQPPEDKCDLIEDFTCVVSISDRLFEEEIACLKSGMKNLEFVHLVSFLVYK